MVRVLLECCGQEGVFNRYYSLLATRLAETYREFRFALQFAFWDAFKQMADLTIHRAANTAKLLSQLILADAVPLACLKVVKWSNPSARATFFWQVFFVELLSAPTAAQRKALLPMRDPSHAELCDGVLLFIERHVRRMLAKQHAGLRGALEQLVRQLEGDAPP